MATVPEVDRASQHRGWRRAGAQVWRASPAGLGAPLTRECCRGRGEAEPPHAATRRGPGWAQGPWAAPTRTGRHRGTRGLGRAPGRCAGRRRQLPVTGTRENVLPVRDQRTKRTKEAGKDRDGEPRRGRGPRPSSRARWVRSEGGWAPERGGSAPMSPLWSGTGWRQGTDLPDKPGVLGHFPVILAGGTVTCAPGREVETRGGVQR